MPGGGATATTPVSGVPVPTFALHSSSSPPRYTVFGVVVFLPVGVVDVTGATPAPEHVGATLLPSVAVATGYQVVPCWLTVTRIVIRAA